jgi:nitroreductase
MVNVRQPDYAINPIFLDRWSPRAFEKFDIPETDLLTILEAARWAPSAFNIQPWRFLYALRGDRQWGDFLSALDEFNRGWAQHSSAIVVVLSDSIMPGERDRPDKASRYNSFDAGAAWAQLALQATALGYQAHAMAGLEFEHAYEVLEIPDRYRLEVAIAIGRQAEAENLPEELRDGEGPSGRLPLAQIACAGSFPTSAGIRSA